MARSFRFVTFLSDYGLSDEYVGVCHGIIKRFAPQVEVIDIAHGVPPQDVVAGSAMLARAVPYMPLAVHLAVVDPGVGTRRRAVVLVSRAGPLLIGPDNGLLHTASEGLGGITQAFSLEERNLWLEDPSRTFHGRDIFAPVAARLALGMPPESVGPEIDIETVVALTPVSAIVDDDHIHARVTQSDHFGNLQMNVLHADLQAIGILDGDVVDVRINGRKFSARHGNAFSDVKRGQLVLLEDAHRWMMLACNQGSARVTVEARRDDTVVLARCPQG